MSTDGTDERELKPLGSSGERQQHDNWQQQQVSEADNDSFDKRSAAQPEEANQATAIQQAPDNAGETGKSNSEVQC